MSEAALIALLIANLIVAAVALLADWGYLAVLVAYWWEAVIVGIFNIGRVGIVCLFGEPFGPSVGVANVGSRVVLALFLSAFFAAKFGGFALMVGFAIMASPALVADGNVAGRDDVVLDALSQVAPGIPITVGVLLISHGISFVTNYIGQREYRRGGILKLLFWPYARMASTLALLALGLLAVYLVPNLAGATVFALAIIAVKLSGDLATHRWEHRRGSATQSAFGGTKP